MNKISQSHFIGAGESVACILLIAAAHVETGHILADHWKWLQENKRHGNYGWYSFFYSENFCWFM